MVNFLLKCRCLLDVDNRFDCDLFDGDGGDGFKNVDIGALRLGAFGFVVI